MLSSKQGHQLLKQSLVLGPVTAMKPVVSISHSLLGRDDVKEAVS